MLLIPWRSTARERNFSIRHNWRLTKKFFLTAQNLKLFGKRAVKKCYFFPSNEILLAHLCIALEPSITFLKNYLALTVQFKTVQWKQWLTPTFIGNRNTMTKMYLKVSTFATPQLEKILRLTASLSYRITPFLESPLPFKNFPIPPFLGFLVRSIPLPL